MSADSVVVFFGVRVAVGDEEVEQLELRRDPRQAAARKLRLDTYWANFGGETEERYFFIGKLIANAGAENPSTVALTDEPLQRMMRETSEKLRGGGWDPAQITLWVQYRPDA